MVSYEFTDNEVWGIYHLASLGFASLLASNAATDEKQKDAEIIRLSSINGLQSMGNDGFDETLRRLDGLREELLESSEGGESTPSPAKASAKEDTE